MSRLPALAILVMAFCSACSNGAREEPDNSAFFDDARIGRSNVEVVVRGTVVAVYRPDYGAHGVHQRFKIELHSDAFQGRNDRRPVTEVLVSDNISVGSPAPVHPGDDVIVKGVLVFDPPGPVIHWTHHDPRFRHVPGYIKIHDKTYD